LIRGKGETYAAEVSGERGFRFFKSGFHLNQIFFFLIKKKTETEARAK